MKKITELFKFSWRLLTIWRNFCLNTIFLFLLISIVVGVISRIIHKEDLPAKGALVLSLTGTIVEEKSYLSPSKHLFSLFDEIDEGSEEDKEILLKDIKNTLRQAKDDPKVTMILLDLDKLGPNPFSKLREVGKYLDDFKKGGKKIWAYADHFGQEHYYLASYANKIFLNPMGHVLIQGYSMYLPYLKRALDKLKISIYPFKAGKYKTAIEPLIRSNMSEESKEANKPWLDALWHAYVQDVKKQQKVDVNKYVFKALEDLAGQGGDTAKLALKWKLVDKLVTRIEMHELLIKEVGLADDDEDQLRDFNRISFKKYLYKVVKKKEKLNKLKSRKEGSNKVGVLLAVGTIRDGQAKSGSIGGDSLAYLIRQAREEEKVKALVLRVDSGGGSAFASEIIRQELVKTQKAGIPVVASMGSMAASGGYWISATANEIWAWPTTLTGSIGVFGLMATFDKTSKSLGIDVDGLDTTKLSSVGHPLLPLNKNYQKMIDLTIKETYNRFIKIVSNGRKMPLALVDKLAQGRVWTGEKAHQLGLVDKLGDLDGAIKSAARLAKLEKYNVRYIKKKLSTKEKIIKDLKHLNIFNNDLMDNVISGFKERFNDPQGLYLMCLECQVIKSFPYTKFQELL